MFARNKRFALFVWAFIFSDAIRIFELSLRFLRYLSKNPKPVKGAIEAIKKLEESGKYEMVIVTTAPWGNTESNTHKREWIEKHFGELFEKQMVITHRKDLIYGDYLIDDRIANGAGEFKGELLRFGWSYEEKKLNEYPTWDTILEKLL